MSTFKEYISIEGDRWDSISEKAYGTPFNVNIIVEANPDLLIEDVFEGGVRVLIPVIDEADENNIEAEDLPPWKR